MGSTHAPTRTPTRAPAALDRGRTEATVFGLDVRAALRLPFLEHARAAPTGRTLEVRCCPSASVASRWSEGARTICAQVRRDGSIHFSIEAHPRAGYRLWGDGAGCHLLSLDGRRLWCAPGGCPRRRWERFLVGQVLPFAALVSGLEIFHASAVVLDGRAIAFVGPSGAGKTSVALELCRRGAGFLADDVLALEPGVQELMAVPGTPVAAVDPRTAGVMRTAGAAPAARVLSRDGGEHVLRMQGAPQPMPLGALFFLDRVALRTGDPSFKRTVDARLLLGSTFNFVLDTPQRMLGLLDVCALAARGRVERIAIPRSIDAGQVADSVIRHLCESR